MKSNRWLTDINLWPPYSIIGTHTGKMNVMALRKYLCGGTHQTISPKLVFPTLGLTHTQPGLTLLDGVHVAQASLNSHLSM